MKNYILLFWAGLFLSITVSADARLRKYINPYDISEIEWQVLNWTAAWRGTTTPAEPFILERIEYERTDVKVHIYLQGRHPQNTQENLDKSIAGIGALFTARFPEFEAGKDLVVSYKIIPADGSGESYKIKYDNGVFRRY